jgi:hypothetical protein
MIVAALLAVGILTGAIIGGLWLSNTCARRRDAAAAGTEHGPDAPVDLVGNLRRGGAL